MMRPEAAEVTSEEPFRVVMSFPDDPDEREGVVKIDEDHEIQVAELLAPSTDGVHRVSVGMRLNQLYLIAGGVTLNRQNDVRSVLITSLDATYEEAVDPETAEEYADTPRC